MADNTPLLAIYPQVRDRGVLREVAAEYAKGRFLLVGTADMDARRPIIWDMGKIATYGGPRALDLFVSIMIASASIPAGVPPVMIDVEADGKTYQEMHVDGQRPRCLPIRSELRAKAVTCGIGAAVSATFT